jgi:hypothetical protein
MEKTRQQELTRWLKQQSVISRRWLTISRLLGFVSGLLIVAQAWLLARILNHMIMENIPARSAPAALYCPDPDFYPARLGGVAA